MSRSPDILPVDPLCPETDRIARAAAIIVAGGVVAFPTGTLYGLAADARNDRAVERIFRIKGRPADKPILVLVPDRDAAAALVTRIGAPAAQLMAALWPGGITLVFEAADFLPAVLCGRSHKVGIRVPGHPVAQALVRAVGGPITGTSANISGRPGCADPSGLDPVLGHGLDLVLDAGPLPGGSGSTVVDVTVHPPALLREGTVPWAKVVEILCQSGGGTHAELEDSRLRAGQA